MDSALRDLLDSYAIGLKTYFDSLPSDNQEVIKAKQLLADMESLAKASIDYSEFMSEAQKKNYFTEIIGFYSKLGNELYKSKPKSNHVPSAAEIAKAYHLAYESMGNAKNDPQVQSIYNRIFQLETESASGPEFISRMEEENLFLKMSQNHLTYIMRDGLEKLLNSGVPSHSSAEKSLGVVSSPQMEHYFSAMQKKMEESRSIIELEINAFEEAENSRFSNLWDSTFLFVSFQSILSPLIGYRMTGSEENKADTKQAYEFVCDFLGVNWETLFENKRIWDFFERTIYGGAKENLNSQNIHSAKELKIDLEKYLSQCVERIDLPIDPTKQLLNFRGEQIKLEEVLLHLNPDLK